MIVLGTDASIFLRTKTAAWAAVVDISGDQWEDKGLLIGEVASSTCAELLAVAAGLNMMGHLDAFWATTEREVDLWCDNETAVALINHQYRARGADIQRAMHAIDYLIEHLEISITCRWLPGHTRNRGLAYDLNRRADWLCGPIARAEHEFRLLSTGETNDTRGYRQARRAASDGDAETPPAESSGARSPALLSAEDAMA